MGIEQAIGRSVDIAINHDPEAISMHQANHPETTHYCEDVFNIDPTDVCKGRPVGLAWFSPDCKHHSKAKGGQPVDKHIRGLAWVAVRWASLVRPRIIMIENVEEFEQWGPLTPENRPCQNRKGLTFRRFVRELEKRGYRVEHRILCAADYGAPTVRRRLFLVARCDGKPIIWPSPTHGKDRQRYNAAADCIDWSLPCPSIFERNKPLADNTLRRIARGIHRYVLNAKNPFIVTHKQPHNNHIHDTAAFMAKHYGGNYTGPGHSLNSPMHTITSVDHHALVSSHLIKLRHHSTGIDCRQPLHTITGGGSHFGEIRTFLIKYYGTAVGQDIGTPVHTVTSKHRLGLVTIHDHDYQIADIGMRMLQPRELYRAQGFPDSYIIDPTYNGKIISKAAQVRMCGNSVPPPFSRALVEANYTVTSLQKHRLANRIS